jgi:hypothetical protein
MLMFEHVHEAINVLYLFPFIFIVHLNLINKLEYIDL